MNDIQILELVLPIVASFLLSIIMKLWANHIKNRKQIEQMNTEIKILKERINNHQFISTERHDDISKQLNVMDKKLTKLIERR